MVAGRHVLPPSFCRDRGLTTFLVERVKWFRDRADRDRKQEEKAKLETDFDLTIKHHAAMSKCWLELSHMPSHRPGAAAYAARHARIYADLADSCAIQREKAMMKAAELGFSFGV
jgi:hypothetical protein